MSVATGERLRHLQESRKPLCQLPCNQLFELPGRPNVLYTLKDYSGRGDEGPKEARAECGFLFKAFETGQIGPRRLARMSKCKDDIPVNTIHDWLDYTVGALEAKDETEYDFSGFRVLLLYPRERNMWPAPNGSQPQPRADPRLGAPLDPWPALCIKGRPLSAATIRAGPGYLEVPFVATHETKRGRGFGRCVVEATEDIARALGIKLLLLCSTCEEHVQSTWKHLGFVETSEADLEGFGVKESDLTHMQNTVQMHKVVPPPRRWRPIIIKHEAFVARTYVPLDRAPNAGPTGAAESFAVGMTNVNGAASSYATASSLAVSGDGNGGGAAAAGAGAEAPGKGGAARREATPASACPQSRTPPVQQPPQPQQQQQQQGRQQQMQQSRGLQPGQQLPMQLQPAGPGPSSAAMASLGMQQQQHPHSFDQQQDHSQQRPLQPPKPEPSSDVLVFVERAEETAEAMEVG